MDVRASFATDIGLHRERNEDSCFSDPALPLFIVADGMGGHAAGEVASKLAIEVVPRTIKKNKAVLERYAADKSNASRQAVLALMEQSLQNACAAIFEAGQQDADKRGMGTTTTALVLAGDRGFIAHVGDSRIYLLRQGKVHQLTEDHSLANELVRRGKIKAGEFETSPYAKFKNAVTRAVGAYESVEVDTFDFEVLPGDEFLLCSDGLHAYLDDAKLQKILAGPLVAAATSFITLANESGGHDNISAVVVQIAPDNSPTESQRSLDLTDRVEALSRIPLFKHLAYKELIAVLNKTEIKDYLPKQDIIVEGQAGSDMFVIVTGRVQLQKAQSALATLERGAHFGEMALIDKSPRSATATALEKSRLLRLNRQDFFEIIRKEPVTATKLLWAFVQVLSDRLRKTTDDLSGALEALEVNDVELFEDALPKAFSSINDEQTKPV